MVTVSKAFMVSFCISHSNFLNDLIVVLVIAAVGAGQQ